MNLNQFAFLPSNQSNYSWRKFLLQTVLVMIFYLGLYLTARLIERLEIPVPLVLWSFVYFAITFAVFYKRMNLLFGDMTRPQIYFFVVWIGLLGGLSNTLSKMLVGGN